MVDVFPSIWSIPPYEQGGPVARKGFDFQDHVGVRLCIGMLLEEKISAICFETHDDLVIQWANETIEFVQVKSEDPGQVLSISWLCKGKKKSILARSLGREACREDCCFRIVTRQAICHELKPLKISRQQRTEESVRSAIAELGVAVAEKLKGIVSPKGLGVPSWVERTLWEVDHDEDALKAGSCIRLDEALEDLGYSLMPADREVIYENMLKAVRHAASLRYEGTFEPKKLTRSQILDLVRERVQSATSGSRGTILLREKLTAAGMASQFEYATSCRRKYLSELHETDYMRRKPLETLSEQVRHKLHDLSTALQVQALTADGPTFYNKCISEVDELAGRLRDITPEDGRSLARGCVFDITNRCYHRFVRIG